METAISSETLISIYEHIGRHITDDWHLRQDICQNLSSWKKKKRSLFIVALFSIFISKRVPSSSLLFTVFDVRMSSCSSQRAPDLKLHLDTLLPLEQGFQRRVGNRFRLYDRYIRIVITCIASKMDTYVS